MNAKVCTNMYFLLCLSCVFAFVNNTGLPHAYKHTYSYLHIQLHRGVVLNKHCKPTIATTVCAQHTHTRNFTHVASYLVGVCGLCYCHTALLLPLRCHCGKGFNLCAKSHFRNPPAALRSLLLVTISFRSCVCVLHACKWHVWFLLFVNSYSRAKYGDTDMQPEIYFKLMLNKVFLFNILFSISF